MIAILLFGAGMVVISLMMIARPDAWTRIVLKFVHIPYFHPLEIVLRIGLGMLFVMVADQSRYPLTIKILGFVLVAVGVGLILTPPSLHRRFAYWSVEKLSGYLRPAAFASLAFGLFLIHAAL